MTLIKQVVAAMADNSLRVGPSEVRAIKHYVRNSQNRRTQEEIRALITHVERGWKLTQEFEIASIEWMHKMCYRAPGKWRDTIQTRRFGARERRAVEEHRFFELCGVSAQPLVYDSNRYPGKERWLNVYPVFRICPSDVKFIFIPWQAGPNSGIQFV